MPWSSTSLVCARLALAEQLLGEAIAMQGMACDRLSVHAERARRWRPSRPRRDWPASA